MHDILWILMLVLGCLFLTVLMIYGQYRKFRRDLPKPSFKHPTARPDPAAWSDEQASFAWIGHSTVYMNLFGQRIVTDPVFDSRVGISIARVGKLGMKRHTAPALHAQDIAPVDVILLSHAHMDHVDLSSLRRLASAQTTVITANGTSHLLRRMKFGQIIELNPHESVTLDSGLEITAIPVNHWGNRMPWNRTYGWTGFVISRGETRVLFAGDTAYTPTLGEAGSAAHVNVALIPIGAYSPDTFQRSHCTPEQAWQMFLETGADYLIPIHWDTFVLSREPVREPMERLLAVAGKQQHRIVIRDHGQTFQLDPNGP